MIRDENVVGVLVGGRKPGEIYDAAVEKTRKAQEEARAGGGQEPRSSGPNEAFFCREEEDFFQIGKLVHGNKLYTIDLSKTLLLNGKAKAQLEWEEYNRSALTADPPGFIVGPASLYFAVLSILYDHRVTNPSVMTVGRARCYLANILRINQLMTCTFAEYNPVNSGHFDRVYQGSRFDSDCKRLPCLAGESGPLTGHQDEEDAAISLTGLPCSRLNDIAKWLLDSKAHILRPRFRPQNTENFAVTFGGMLRGKPTPDFYIDAVCKVECPALGIRYAQIETVEVKP